MRATGVVAGGSGGSARSQRYYLVVMNGYTRFSVMGRTIRIGRNGVIFRVVGRQPEFGVLKGPAGVRRVRLQP